VNGAARATAPAPSLAGRSLVVRLGGLHAVLSWAIVGGGRRSASEVVFCEVRDDELRPPVDPARLLRERLAALAAPSAVGLLTSRAVDTHVVAERELGGAWARCVATVGLGNALRAGDPPGPAARIGTINIVCQVSGALAELALVEAVSIAAEARTAAILEAGVASRRSGERATGTGTDCIVIAAPERDGGSRYAGKHTTLGHVIGASVYDAVRRGAAAWLAEHPAMRPGPPPFTVASTTGESA